MNKRRILGVGTLVIALVLSITSVTIAFAALNTNLTIKGTAKMKGSKWAIKFTDLKTVVTGNDRTGVVATAAETQTPTITGDTAIGNYRVEFATPGDYAYYDFTISNTGDFDAVIDDSFAMPTPSCEKGTNGVDEDKSKVCNNLVYTLKYLNEDNTEGEAVKVGDTLAHSQSKNVRLKLYFNKAVAEAEGADSSVLPFDDVEIGNLNITIPFIQQ